MAKLKIDVDVTGKAQVKDLDKSFKQLEHSSRDVDTQNQKTSSSFKSMAVKGALVVGALYAINKAMRLLVADGFSYNKSLEEAEAGLIALSVAVQDKAIPVIDRYANATREATYSLKELQKINAETPHTLEQTNKIYKAMYVSMRGVGAKTDEMIDLTKKLSIAAGAAGIEFNSLLAGVDGLATGTVLANSDLGRFLGGLGLTNKALKESDDIMALLTEKFEDFQAADTMQVALSNVNNAWSIFAGNVTKPVFEGVKKSLNLISKSMNEYAPQAMQTFSDALVSMVNAGVKSIGFLAKVINQLIGTIQIAYSGYQKLAGFIGGGDTTKMRVELEELKKEHTTLALQERRALQKKIDETERWNDARRGGDDLHQQALERTEALNKLIGTGVEKMTIEYGKIPVEIEEQEAPLETVFKKIEKIGKEQDKNSKAAKKALKEKTKLQKKADSEAKKALDRYNRDIEVLTSSYEGAATGLAESFSRGDLVGMFDSIGAGFLTALDDMETGYSAFSKALDGITMSSVWGALLWAGSKVLSSFMGDVEEAPPQLGELHDLSESIENSLNDIVNVQFPMLDLTRQMTGYLQSISNAFGGLENALTRSDVDIGGGLFQPTAESGFLFGGKTKDLYGTSIDIEAATVGELLNSQIDAYLTTVTKIVSTTWYGKSKTYYEEDVANISDSVSQYISEATASAFDIIQISAEALDLSTLGLEGMTIDIGQIETTGLSSEEISAEIERRFGAELDAISEAIFAPIAQYQKAGEGLFETAVRVARDMDQVTFGLEQLEITLEETTKSITINLPLIGERTFEFTTRIYDLTEAMIAGAGGIDALQMGMLSYSESFLSQQEQYDMMVNEMNTSFETLGLTMPDLTGSAEEVNARFRSLVEGIDTNTIAGAQLFGEIMTLADGFAEMTDAAESLTDAERDRQQAALDLVETEIKAAEELIAKNKLLTKSYADTISDLMLGTYSDLSIASKEEFARGFTDIARESEGTISIVDALRSEMELAFKYATTQEEYGVYVDRLAEQMGKEAPEATNDDIVDRLDALILITNELNETTKMTA